ncbi:hypothetical protein HRI_001983900 [Hibiscus trionum]|uniref:Uncharacterized protein n=1 Tax=Hibiscus trionum TaxID=183268 RepID=A0A9W7HTJ8_HIBTR|nr:hypothetical protein HRI_001983900 [Hibiscus trionum]
MEESGKINGKKKLPSIPTNYVTLLQLQERWIKEKERKHKGKEEEEEAEPRQQEEKETIVEERIDDEVSGRRGDRRKGRFPRLIQDNGKRVSEVKPCDEIIAPAEDFNTEKKCKELKKNRRNKKRNGVEEKVRAANEEEVKGRAGNALLPASTENNEGEGEEEAHAPKLTSAEEVNVEAMREPRRRITPRTHGRKAEIGRKFQAMSMDDNIITGVHAPKLVSVEEENVEARMESEPRIMPRTHDRTAEIGRKFQAMSMNGELRTGHCRRYGRQNIGFNHRRVNPESNKTYHGGFGRRRELNQRNEWMIWVKKGEVKDQSVDGIQSSSCSSKEVD